MMGCIYMYVEEPDLDVLLRWLNEDDEVAFIVANGPKRWVAKKRIDNLNTNSTQALWHIPFQWLPLIVDFSTHRMIEDPWSGWEEIRQGADPREPYFGPGCAGIIWLDPKLNQTKIPISTFQWIGNYYGGATEETERWWKRLRKRMTRELPKLPRTDDSSRKPEVFTFPSALKAIEDGKPRAEW